MFTVSHTYFIHISKHPNFSLHGKPTVTSVMEKEIDEWRRIVAGGSKVEEDFLTC